MEQSKHSSSPPATGFPSTPAGHLPVGSLPCRAGSQQVPAVLGVVAEVSQGVFPFSLGEGPAVGRQVTPFPRASPPQPRPRPFSVSGPHPRVGWVSLLSCHFCGRHLKGARTPPREHTPASVWPSPHRRSPMASSTADLTLLTAEGL